MFSPFFTALLVYLFLVSNLFGRRSPYVQKRSLPTTEWANQPVKLVPTPWAETRSDDLITMAATHMALLHNSMIRGFNSIYLQARHIEDGDVGDFVTYSLAWHRFIQSHHDDEEDVLFPNMVGIFDDDKIWGNMKEEHESFLEGLGEFRKYLSGVNATTGLSGEKLVKIMDSFRQPLEDHLHNEVTQIAQMAKHPNAPVRGSLNGEIAAEQLKAWGKNTVTKAGYRDVVPFFLLNHDHSFEDGLWRKWPKMPAPIRWVMVNIVGMWHGQAWKFASCDALGVPRQLHALEPKTKPAEDEKREQSEL